MTPDRMCGGNRVILRFGGVLLSYNPSAGSRQTGSVMVVMRLKTEWLSPILLPEVPHVATMSRQHGHRPGYKVIACGTIKPMRAPQTTQPTR